ncbi:MAG: site-specific DNA-methyltransferase [Planctomycetaceae bacterium]|nr:site-specific DNA-methyltransferase [Planctomycetaceae bacterium]
MSASKLILGDNIEIMKSMESESVDLIYLDPPFFSNRNYEVIWGDDGEIRSFQDRWAGGIEHYIAWLKERVIEMHRLLKSTGSIFLHCDWHANAYIRVDILDKIFGQNNFRNEIIWKRTNAKGLAFTRLPRNNDSIFYYTKSDSFVFNSLYIPHSDKYLSDFYKYTEPETGRLYRLGDLTNPNKDRPNLTYEFLGVTRVWRWTRERMQKAYDKGLIVQSKPGAVPRLKGYLDEQEGTPVDDNWLDIINVQSTKEKIGYPTQKPEALLNRIINIASNDGDIVLDPFVGGGTTAAVADRLKRRWIGIDQSVAAIKVSDLRLKNQRDLYSAPYELQLHTYDYDALRNLDPIEFQNRIIEKFGGIPNPKPGSDFGLDGWTADNTPIQVKRSDNIGRNVIDNFLSAVQRNDERLFDVNRAAGKPVGHIIAFSFGKGAIEEVARLKNKKQIIIELVKVGNILPLGSPPRVSLAASELEKQKYAFEATAESDAGIEFYSWDFNHKPDEGFKPDVFLDKTGKQIKEFQPGEHQIAALATDKKGLDGIGTVDITVEE